jgi:excisionase family DNA binding protein
MAELRDYLRPSEAARKLGISVELLRQWLRDGRLPHVRTPLGRLVPVAEVERLAAERQQQKQMSKGGRA